MYTYSHHMIVKGNRTDRRTYHPRRDGVINCPHCGCLCEHSDLIMKRVHTATEENLNPHCQRCGKVYNVIIYYMCEELTCQNS